MSQIPHRNAIVALLGTPARTEGSLNDPRLYDENGFRFNEKWIYRDLTEDPTGLPLRIIYWWRYDFIGTLVRATEHDSWRPDEKLLEVVTKEPDRLSALDPARNPPVTPSNSYRPASTPDSESDLGGHPEGDPRLF